MSFLVQKYGGTSVGNPERIRNVASRVAESHQAGHRLVVVVSAMSGVTDSLIKLAREVNPEATAREVDVLLSTGEQQTIALLAMALHGLGIPAVSLTGAQAGIVTDGIHTKAKILNISPKKAFEALDSGHVVIVAGFQGQNEEGHITTLGRGGSVARFTRTWTASIPPTHASSRTRRSFRKFPTMKCWNSPASAPRSCRPVRSSLPKSSK